MKCQISYKTFLTLYILVPIIDVVYVVTENNNENQMHVLPF